MHWVRPMCMLFTTKTTLFAPAVLLVALACKADAAELHVYGINWGVTPPLHPTTNINPKLMDPGPEIRENTEQHGHSSRHSMHGSSSVGAVGATSNGVAEKTLVGELLRAGLLAQHAPPCGNARSCNHAHDFVAYRVQIGE